MYEKLFSEGRIGSLTIPNRIVMEPMGHHLADANGDTNDRVVAFYATRAKGGVGLIITEVVRVNDEHGMADTGQMSLAKDERMPGIKNLADAVHSYGGKVFVQLNHPGCQGFCALNGNEPMRTPSGVVSHALNQPCRAMTVEEIHELVQDFGAAAKRAKECGIDGVELHGAHGYLINQFLSPYTNKRTDEYGGSTENRARFLLEIMDAVRASCGPDYPMIARISVDEFLEMNGIDAGLKLEDGIEICKIIEAHGIDAIDVSAGIYETMNVSWEPAGYAQGWKSYLAKAVKEAVKIPVFCTSVIRDPEFAEQLLEDGVCDFVGSARQNFADPEWPKKAKEGRADEIRKCISCLNCMECLVLADQSGIPVQCAINIMAGDELKYAYLKENGNGRTVAVLGAGPAGLEAARILAMRGFKPVVFEAKDRIGGQLEYANKPPKKDKITWLIDYYRSQIRKYDIEVRLNTPATVEALRELAPYRVFASTGSVPVMPRSIEGISGPNVLTTTQILTGEVRLSGETVCVVGSGMTGIETADLLAEQGNKVLLYEMLPDIGPGIFFQNLMDVMGRLGQYDVKLFPGHKLLRLNENSAEFEVVADGSTDSCRFDHAVISLGTRPNSPGEDVLNAFDVTLLGDAEKPGRIRHAVETGFVAAYNLE